MQNPVRPRRSLLYMPASNARALEKAQTLAADGLIFDLEDAVAPDAKETARQQAVAAASSGAYGGREIVIRVNGLETPWGPDDIAAAGVSGADALLLPKVESAAMVRELESRIDGAGGPAEMAIWCMIETPLGVLRAAETATASSRGECLVMGTSDLVKDLHARHTPDRLAVLGSLSHCLLVARASGLAILDGVHLDLADHDAFEAACRQGLELGFDGKTLIHPSQLETANRVFQPAPAELQEAREIVAAHGAAAAAGRGVVLLKDRLIENLHVQEARRLLDMEAAIEALQAAER